MPQNERHRRCMVMVHERVGRVPRYMCEATLAVQRRFTHKKIIRSGQKMARARKMATVTASGTRLEQLENLAIILAKQIDMCTGELDDSMKTVPQLVKQYRETIKEIEEIRGMEKDDDEIGEILSARKADGKPDAVR